MIILSKDIAARSLHLSLGITSAILRLGAEVVHASAGTTRTIQLCKALGLLLIEKAGVLPAPFFGVAFEGHTCHHIGRKLTLVCDLLHNYATATWTAPFCRACVDWQAVLPILIRSAAIAPDDIDEFER